MTRARRHLRHASRALLFLLVALGAGCGPRPGRPPVTSRPPATQPATRPASRPATQPATQPASHPATQPASAPVCSSWVVEYELVPATALRVADTYMGAGDGIYLIGPGTARLRFTDGGGAPAPGAAALLDLELTTRFTLNTSALGFKMRIVTDGTSGFTPDGCGIVARGAFDDDRLSWSEAARGYRSAGALSCHGVLCGKFGSPPPGRSRLVRGPRTVRLKPFQFRDGVSRFSMGFVEVERQHKPSQTVLLRLEARESSRRCVPTPPCTVEAAP